MSAAAPAAALPSEPFTEEVRATLDHLYDAAFLHNHPLARRLSSDGSASSLTRAQRLRTLLLDAIEQLRPQLRPEGRFPSEEMRAYAILTYRCMDGMAMDEIAAKLGLSRRQAYREYAKGVEAVAGFLWEALPPSAIPATPEPGTPEEDPLTTGLATRLDAAAQEVARLASNLTLEAVDLPAVAASAADLLAPRTVQTGVYLRLQTSAVTPVLADPPVLADTLVIADPPVLADRALLRQALLNLFSYALDQACRGSEVAVASVQTDHSAGLSLTACAAVPAANAASEPDPANETADVPPRREGVGVSVAQKLIEAMGGQLQIEATGLEWRCSLLLPTAQRATVLVVDDNADLTALFQRYAAGRQITVAGATSGSQALELAQELHPQLVILDLMLAPMDGWEILQQLRRCPATARTPIVICSVLNERDLAFSLGASDYVTKPISQAAWIDVLQRWLGKPHPCG